MTIRARIAVTAAVALAALVVAPARAAAQTEAGSAKAGLAGWSVVGAETVHGRQVLDVQSGWPSTTFGYTMGLSPTTDVSFRLGLLYGYEGTTNSQFGLSFYAPLRFQLLQTHDFKLLFHVDPGLKLYTTSSAQFGFQFPVGLVMGFPDPAEPRDRRRPRLQHDVARHRKLRAPIHLRSRGGALRGVPPHARSRRWPQHPLRGWHRRVLDLPGKSGRDEHLVRLHDAALRGIPVALAGQLPRPAPCRAPPRPSADPTFLDNGGGFR